MLYRPKQIYNYRVETGQFLGNKCSNRVNQTRNLASRSAINKIINEGKYFRGPYQKAEVVEQNEMQNYTQI